MTIYGVSQSSGVERRLTLEQGGEGVVLSIIDHATNKERQRILVQVDDLLGAVTEAPAGGTSVPGVVPPHGTPLQLDLEVRRNEVLIALRADGGETDVAVGLDDFQDALEGVIRRA